MRQAGFHPVIASDASCYLLYPPATGLTGVILSVLPRRKSALQDPPHVKIALNERDDVDAVVVISDHPYILEGALPAAVGRKVFTFIQCNRDILQALWDEGITPQEAAQRLQPGY